MSLTDHFMPIIPRHQRLLERLAEQIRIDRYGAIGWKGLLDEGETFTIDELFKPLVERGLVEDLSHTDLGKAGIYFVHITPIGLRCLDLGMMLKEPRFTTEKEMTKIIGPPTPKVIEAVKEARHAD